MASQEAKSEVDIEIIGVEPLTGLGISAVKFGMKVVKGKLYVSSGYLKYKGFKYEWKAMSMAIPESNELWLVFERPKVMISERGQGIALGRIFEFAGQLRGWRRYHE